MADQKVVWSPQPGAQEAAIACPVEELFYGGARGGGKTDFLIGDFAIHEARYGKEARGLFIRRTLTELADVKVRMQEVYGPNGLGWEYKKSESEWQAPSGGFLRLRYLDRDEDAEKYQGWNLTWVGIDEVGNFPNPEPIDKLWGALRSTAGVPTFMRLTGNPGGVGHGWIRGRYVSPRPKGWEVFRYRPQPELQPKLVVECVFIPAKLEDNPLLTSADPKYEQRLAQVGGKALYRAWRFGDWDAIVGAAFTEWRPDLHVQPLDPLPGWRLAGAVDWGYRAHGCLLLGASGPEGEALIFDEIYFKERTGRDMGRESARKAKGWGTVEYIVGDTQMWQATGTGVTIAEQFQQGMMEIYGMGGGTFQHGFPALVGERKIQHAGKPYRIAKKNLVHEYLSWSANPQGEIKPWQKPRLIIHPRCIHLIRTLPALPVDPRNPEDIDTTAEDHAYDALCSYLMSRPPMAGEVAERRFGGDPDRHPGFRGNKRKPRYIDMIRKKYSEEDEPGELVKYPEGGTI